MNSDPVHKGGVLVIGNFDGVHKGHETLLDMARREAEARQVPAAVLSFTPHPRQFFNPDLPPSRLTTDAQKKALLKGSGVDFVYFEKFDSAMSALSPVEFVENILADKYAPVCVIVGFNFYFGKGRAGDAARLQELCAARGIEVQIAPSAGDAGAVYSSSRAREYLRAGDLSSAAAILGRPFTISGPVLHGDKRGRELGYPTANQSMDGYVRPPYGIYAVRVQLPSGQQMDGVANLGVRPMFEVEEPLLETFIFDFSGDLYGENLQVSLMKHLRDEKKFADIDALVLQMKQDETRARQFLKELTT